MSDPNTGLPVQTISGQFVAAKITDSGGTNQAAVSAANRLSVDLTGVGGTTLALGQAAMASSIPVVVANNQSNLPANITQWTGVGVTAAAAFADATALPTVPIVGAALMVANGTPTLDRARAANADAQAATGLLGVGNMVWNTASWDRLREPTADALTNATGILGAGLLGYNGTTWDRVRTANTGRLQVDVITGGAGTQYVGDAAATATPTGTIAMGLANAAAPSDVSANNDAVAQWMLRNGSAVVNLASGGTLITIGQKTAANSLPVTLPSDGYGSGATAPIHAILGTGAADYTLFGQTAATAPFARITDATTTAGVIVANNALKSDMSSVGGTNIAIGQAAMAASLPVVIANNQSNVPINLVQIGGATQSATAPLFVRLTDGTTAYTAASIAPTAPVFSKQTSAALGAGASATLVFLVTSGKTGRLAGIDLASTVPLKIVINTRLTGSDTARDVLFTPPYSALQWRTPFPTYITQLSADGTTGFSATLTNLDASVAADIYATAYYDQV